MENGYLVSLIISFEKRSSGHIRSNASTSSTWNGDGIYASYASDKMRVYLKVRRVGFESHLE